MKYDSSAPKVKPRVMGVLNVTPDSFSDGNQYNSIESAVDHAKLLALAGAEIIDIGGESTRPGAERVSIQEEQDRVLPVIKAIVDLQLGVQISIDTMNAETAQLAIASGADIINDVSGGLADERMFAVVAKLDVPIVVSHWRGHSDIMNTMTAYQNVAEEVARELQARVEAAMLAGVKRENIIIDPGLVKQYLDTDPQMILPKLILNHAPLIAQIMFFGALLSAIKSCASATLLAPSVTFAENIVKGFFKHLSDQDLLKVMRMTVLCFAVVVTFFAINSDLSIFKMVESAYKVTLVAAFVPLAFGIYWSKANSLGGLLAVLGGLTVWIGCEILAPHAILPPQLAGLLASIVGMLLGGLVPRTQLTAN
jgi:dihydropteroate synthase